MTRTRKLANEFFVSFQQYERGEITREEYDRRCADLHVALNGPEPGRLIFSSRGADTLEVMTREEHAGDHGDSQGIATSAQNGPPRNDGEVSGHIPTKSALNCLAACMRAEDRAYLVMSIPKGDLDGTVSVRFDALTGEEALAMICAFVEKHPDVKKGLLHIYGEEAMDLRVDTEAIKAMREQDLDREIEAVENEREKVTG